MSQPTKRAAQFVLNLVWLVVAVIAGALAAVVVDIPDFLRSLKYMDTGGPYSADDARLHAIWLVLVPAIFLVVTGLVFWWLLRRQSRTKHQ